MATVGIPRQSTGWQPSMDCVRKADVHRSNSVDARRYVFVTTVRSRETYRVTVFARSLKGRRALIPAGASAFSRLISNATPGGLRRSPAATT